MDSFFTLINEIILSKLHFVFTLIFVVYYSNLFDNRNFLSVHKKNVNRKGAKTFARHCKLLFFFSKTVQQRHHQVELQQESMPLTPPLSTLSFNRPPKACGGFGGGKLRINE